MKSTEIERLIKSDILSIENRVRHAFNQGYDLGYKEGIEKKQSKTGHWEWVQYDYNPKLGNWHCSECRCVVVECVGKEEKGGIPIYKYCPQCGTKMVDPQEESDKDADKKCTYKETGCGSCKRQLDCPIEADMAESEPQERSDKA